MDQKEIMVEIRPCLRLTNKKSGGNDNNMKISVLLKLSYTFNAMAF